MTTTEQAKQLAQIMRKDTPASAGVIDALVAENERLRGALNLVATAENSALDLAYCKGIARAALGETKS